jgi:hypothetical protein
MLGEKAFVDYPGKLTEAKVLPFPEGRRRA